MLGLIKKDFLIIKANLKSMVITFIVYLMLAFQGTFDVTFIIPIIGIMLFISTFSYDDFNNWNSYAVTLPDGRRNVVRAKYIASIILTVVLGIIALAIGIGISYIKTNAINLNEIISSLMGTALSSITIISLLYPIVINYPAAEQRGIRLSALLKKTYLLMIYLMIMFSLIFYVIFDLFFISILSDCTYKITVHSKNCLPTIFFLLLDNF